MSRHPTLRNLVIGVLLFAGGVVVAGERLYSWRDAQGDLHYSDNIEQVPEPFRSQFLRAEQQAGDAPAGNKPSAAAPQRPKPASPPAGIGSPPSRPDPDERDKLRWQSETRKLQRQLAAAEQKLTAARAARDDTMRRYRETRVIARRQEAEKQDAEIAKLEKELERIRHQLEVELPQRARQQGVPPGWLR